MESGRSTGRIVGILLFLQLAALGVGFVSAVPLTTSGFLENALGVSFQIRAAVLALFVSSAITVGIAVAGFPVFRELSYRMALSFVAVSIIWFAVQSVDNVHMMSMLSLSQHYAQNGAANSELFEALGTVVRSTRAWSHNTELLIIDGWFFLLYALLFRFSLIPRALAGFGMLMAAIHTTGISLPMFIGYERMLVLAYSLPLGQVAVGTWLVVKGFAERSGRITV